MVRSKCFLRDRDRQGIRKRKERKGVRTKVNREKRGMIQEEKKKDVPAYLRDKITEHRSSG